MPIDDRTVDVDEGRVAKPDGLFGQYLQAQLRVYHDTAPTAEYYNCRFFNAARDFEIVRITSITSSASSDASASLDVRVVRDGATPAGSQSCLLEGLELDATADALQVAEVAGGRESVLVRTGDCLAAVPSGDLCGMSDLLLTVFLKAI